MYRFFSIIPWVIVVGLLVPQVREYLDDRKPPSDWFIAHSVVVSSTKEGNPIYLHVYREIKQEFRGEWTVTVRKIEENRVIAACTASNALHYSPKAVLPDPLTLDWWTYPVKCILPPGKYQMETEWEIRTSGNPKHVKILSNVFEILPKV